MKCYKVMCERGHCGSGKASVISFAFQCANLLEAVDMARSMPSVKHTKMCVKAYEITEVEYYEYISISAYERNPQGRRR